MARNFFAFDMVLIKDYKLEIFLIYDKRKA